MTNEEAIKDIEENIKPVVGGKSLDMAIRALKNEQTDGDLINRSSVITMLQKICNAVDDGEGFQLNEWVEYTKDIPSAEKTAEWSIVGKTTLHYECSKCGGAGDKWDKFCPNCGARMKGADS